MNRMLLLGNVDIKMMGSAEWAFLWSGIIGF